MIPKLQHIGRLKLTGDTNKDIQELHKVTANLEEYLCKKISNSVNAAQDSTTLTNQITNLQGVVSALTVSVITNAFPGFGTDALHASRGDHTHTQLKYFVKQGSQIAVLGLNTVVFDVTAPFTSNPNVWCWLSSSDGTFSPLIVNSSDVSTTGFTVTTINIDGSPNLNYYAVGS